VTRTALGHPEPDPDPDYRWISPVTAADILGVTVPELRRMIDRGEVPAYRIDGETRLRLGEVERACERRRHRNGDSS
jgi:excisionase family DNA binding protein